jgi:hypothetical protein
MTPIRTVDDSDTHRDRHGIICEIDFRDIELELELELELHLDLHRLATTTTTKKKTTVRNSRHPNNGRVQEIHQAFRRRKKFMFMSEKDCPK